MIANPLKVDRRDGLAIVTLSRPPVNALNLGIVESALALLSDLEGDPELRAVVVTGSGSCFSAGLDLKEAPCYSAAEQRRMIGAINRLLFHMFGLRRPTVAAMNGHAQGGGLVLALSCDYRVGPLGSFKLGLTEARAGVPYPTAALAVVKSELPVHAARSLVLGAHNVDPETALRLGVVDELQPPPQVLARALAVAADLARFPAESYIHSKRALRQEALARMRAAIDNGHDDLLDHWLTQDTVSASLRLLAQ
jgi:enoyl-CoA hydratase